MPKTVSQRLILRLIVDWCCPKRLEAIAPDRSHSTPSSDARVSTSTTMDLRKKKINSDDPTSSHPPLGGLPLINAKSASTPDQAPASRLAGPLIDQGFRPLFPSQTRLVRPLALALSALAPQGPGRYSALGMEALLGRGGGWLVHRNQRWFRLKGRGRGGWGSFPSWLNPEGECLDIQ